MRFTEYLESQEEQKDVEKTLNKIPTNHRRFVQGFKISFEPGNTLQGDNKHVGVITTSPEKKIIIAAPWRYSRQFTLLHEIGHLVWEYLVNDVLRQQWIRIVNSTKHKQNQNAEELFCMAYADTYADHKVLIHHHPEWVKFIQNLPN